MELDELLRQARLHAECLRNEGESLQAAQANKRTAEILESLVAHIQRFMRFMKERS